MPQYVFYPETLDGCSASMQVFELAGDVQALIRAETVIADHRSSRSVAVWLEDRLILTVFRPERRAAIASAPASRALQAA